MAKVLQLRRGTTAENNAFTGLESELTVDTEKHALRLHDGVKQGGYPVATKAELDSVAEQIADIPDSDAFVQKTGGVMVGNLYTPTLSSQTVEATDVKASNRVYIGSAYIYVA